ncbi:MAG: Crp/Fnr family transcriptional regulator [Proteobacteria bacterium]|nr:Crp/Fnr family transcriptional regulator [Pseudomonadota bacterium]
MGDPLFARYGKKAAAKEVLFREGEAGAEMFVIRTGSVRVFIEANGVEKTLAVLGPSEFVGEMSLLTGQPRSATAVVEEEAELLVVGTKVLEEMIVQNTEIALRLIRKLARRLESADSLIQVLLHRDPKQRVIENLKRLASLHGWTAGKGVTIQADCDAMAEQVGLEFSEVQDIISRLVRAGALAEKEGSWVIKDPEKIGEFLKFLQMKGQFT